MRAVLASTIVLVSAIALPQTSHAASFDGSWSVVIVTERGSCDQSTRFPVVITDGRVKVGETAVVITVAGSVQQNGKVTVRVTRGEKSAQGTGTLGGKTGRGTWIAGDGECAGYWEAERR